MIFDDDLHKKEGELDYYYDILTLSKNQHFSKKG